MSNPDIPPSAPVYNGWALVITDDLSFDRGSCFHDAVNVETGERQALHWSPFKRYELHHFQYFVDSGFPGPMANGNWFPADIDDAIATYRPAIREMAA